MDGKHARHALGLPANALVVLLFGVLRPDKGLNDLLDAIEEASPWHALIAGEDHGGLASATERLASPQLAGRVTVVEGFQPIDVVGRLFAAADLVALPYPRASQSGVLHLAYGFGKPVVVYPVGGLPEAVIPGVTGWVCSRRAPPRSPGPCARSARWIPTRASPSRPGPAPLGGADLRLERDRPGDRGGLLASSGI